MRACCVPLLAPPSAAAKSRARCQDPRSPHLAGLHLAGPADCLRRRRHPCAEIDPEQAQVVGLQGLETWCRRHGLGVIHGGRNALRFTPHFAVTSAEVDLIVSIVREGLQRVRDAQALAAEQRVPASAELRA